MKLSQSEQVYQQVPTKGAAIKFPRAKAISSLHQYKQDKFIRYSTNNAQHGSEM